MKYMIVNLLGEGIQSQAEEFTVDFTNDDEPIKIERHHLSCILGLSSLNHRPFH